MHNHDKCKHELKYCDICDVVYCEKCKKEWHKNTLTITSPDTTWVPEHPFTYTYCNHN